MFEYVIKEAVTVVKDFSKYNENNIHQLGKFLQVSAQEIKNYSNLSENSDASEVDGVHNVDTLREKIAEVHPEFNEQNISKMKGDVTEDMMHSYFKNSGWSTLEGEVGSNGIDGLYIKRGDDAHVSDVLVSESKYNRSQLKETNSGMQMSKDWLLDKMDNLIKAHPENSDYTDIKEFISEDKYRARLWKMNEVNNSLHVSLDSISSDGKEITISPLQGNENYKINHTSNRTIDLQKPNTLYHGKLVNSYNNILDRRLYT